jgi:CspA family cold shock protein
MTQGKIKYWKEDRGFGFVARDDGQPDRFLHISAVSGTWVPEVGDRVEFDVDPGARETGPSR